MNSQKRMRRVAKVQNLERALRRAEMLAASQKRSEAATSVVVAERAVHDAEQELTALRERSAEDFVTQSGILRVERGKASVAHSDLDDSEEMLRLSEDAHRESGKKALATEKMLAREVDRAAYEAARREQAEIDDMVAQRTGRE